jgi:hypothetical protein
LFLGLHLATTASAIGGGGTYDSVLTALRDVYRPSLVVEILLIAIPALTHIVCAVLKILYRRRHRPAPARLGTFGFIAGQATCCSR